MENDLTTQLTPAMLGLIPIIVAVLQVLRKLPVVEKYKAYIPFIAMLLSAGAIYALNEQIMIIPGVLMGLMASGFYNTAKSISKKTS